MMQISAAYFQLPIFSPVTLVVYKHDRGEKGASKKQYLYVSIIGLHQWLDWSTQFQTAKLNHCLQH